MTLKGHKLVKTLLGVTLLFSLLLFFLFSNKVIQVLFPEKVWVHRVNTIDKLHTATKHRQGIELDIYYHNADSCFYVSHDKQFKDTLLLSDFLTVSKRSFNGKYWLDFKNLHEQTTQDGLNELTKLVNTAGLKKQDIIIECIRPSKLIPFAKIGFQTSYYLSQNLHKNQNTQLNELTTKIQAAITNQPIDYISTNYKDYDLIHEYFPDTDKLFWFTTYGSQNKIKARILLYKILLDPKVKVLLVPIQ